MAQEINKVILTNKATYDLLPPDGSITEQKVSSELLDRLVTTDTEQSIYERKYFSKGIDVGSGGVGIDEDADCVAIYHPNGILFCPGSTMPEDRYYGDDPETQFFLQYPGKAGTIALLDDVQGGGSGKPIYLHTVKIDFNYQADIICEIATPFTAETLNSWLLANKRALPVSTYQMTTSTIGFSRLAAYNDSRNLSIIFGTVDSSGKLTCSELNNQQITSDIVTMLGSGTIVPTFTLDGDTLTIEMPE